MSDRLHIFIIDNYSKIFIGEQTTFEEASINIADDYNSIIIGEDCMFARQVRLLASDFYSIMDINSGKRINFSNGICISNHVWVGEGSKILKTLKLIQIVL